MSCRPLISRSSIDFMSLVKVPISDVSSSPERHGIVGDKSAGAFSATDVLGNHPGAAAAGEAGPDHGKEPVFARRVYAGRLLVLAKRRHRIWAPSLRT